jgi:hypothetical protein
MYIEWYEDILCLCSPLYNFLLYNSELRIHIGKPRTIRSRKRVLEGGREGGFGGRGLREEEEEGRGDE